MSKNVISTLSTNGPNMEGPMLHGTKWKVIGSTLFRKGPNVEGSNVAWDQLETDGFDPLDDSNSTVLVTK